MRCLSTFLLCILLYASCTKDSSSREITITGQLLQSSSNPAAASNIKLSFYQAGSGSNLPIVLPGETFSSSIESVTDNNGYFKTNFKRGSGILSSNHDSISISATTGNYGEYFIGNIPAANIDLGSINFYKQVHTAIIEITPEKSIKPGDSIYISAITDTGFYYKLITGISVPANTPKLIDTITNTKAVIKSILKKEYNNTVFVSLNNIYGGDAAAETPIDENEKTYYFSLKN